MLLPEFILDPGDYGQLRSRQGDQFRTSQGETGLKRSAAWGAETCVVVWVSPRVREHSDKQQVVGTQGLVGDHVMHLDLEG